MSTVVVPGARSAHGLHRCRVVPRTTSTSAAGAARACTASTVGWPRRREIGLGEHDGHLGPVSRPVPARARAPQVHPSPTGWATMTRSKLAAGTWGTARSVGSRTNSRVRGAMASMTPLSCAGGHRHFHDVPDNGPSALPPSPGPSRARSAKLAVFQTHERVPPVQLHHFAAIAPPRPSALPLPHLVEHDEHDETDGDQHKPRQKRADVKGCSVTDPFPRR